MIIIQLLRRHEAERALSCQDEFSCLDSRVGMNYDSNASKINSWHDNLIVCPECFLHGVHLTFHQSPHWAKCPIHYTNLQETCISCGEALEAFEARYTRVGFSCKTDLMGGQILTKHTKYPPPTSLTVL